MSGPLAVGVVDAATRPPTRELHALILQAGNRLLTALRDALDGGPAILPIDPSLPAARVDELLDALRPTAVVTDDGPPRRRPGGRPGADDVAVVVATSGSTGVPKGVELTAEALRSSAMATLAALSAGAHDRWLCCLPICHIAGIQVLVRALVAGSRPIIHERFDPCAVARCDFEFTALVPTMLDRLLDAAPNLASRPSWRRPGVLVGGAGLPRPLRQRAEAAGARCVETYGMTETCGGVVYDGRPLSGVEVRLDADQRILLRGPMLARGYRGRPDLTQRSFVDGWLRTDDAGRSLPDGRLEVLGRLDNVVVCGGRKVFPERVESLLASHPDVTEVAVAGRPDPEWGERAVAYVVPAAPGSPPTLDALRAYVAERAEAWLAPRELVLVARLPRTATGKLDRRRVPNLL